MRAVGLRVEDVGYLAPYEAWRNMSGMRISRKRMYEFIRREFGVSRSSMQNIVARFERTIDNGSGDYGDEQGGV